MSTMEIINPEGIHDTRRFAYSHAVRMGDLVFVAGTVALDAEGNLVGKGDAKAQAEQVFANLAAILDAAGSGLDRIGKMTVFVTDIAFRPFIHELRTRLFAPSGMLPASTLAVVTSLASPDWLVEIEAVAMVR